MHIQDPQYFECHKKEGKDVQEICSFTDSPQGGLKSYFPSHIRQAIQVIFMQKSFKTLREEVPFWVYSRSIVFAAGTPVPVHNERVKLKNLALMCHFRQIPDSISPLPSGKDEESLKLKFKRIEKIMKIFTFSDELCVFHHQPAIIIKGRSAIFKIPKCLVLC